MVSHDNNKITELTKRYGTTKNLETKFCSRKGILAKLFLTFTKGMTHKGKSKLIRGWKNRRARFDFDFSKMVPSL